MAQTDVVQRARRLRKHAHERQLRADILFQDHVERLKRQSAGEAARATDRQQLRPADIVLAQAAGAIDDSLSATQVPNISVQEDATIRATHVREARPVNLDPADLAPLCMAWVRGQCAHARSAACKGRHYFATDFEQQFHLWRVRDVGAQLEISALQAVERREALLAQLHALVTDPPHLRASLLLADDSGSVTEASTVDQVLALVNRLRAATVETCEAIGRWRAAAEQNLAAAASSDNTAAAAAAEDQRIRYVATFSIEQDVLYEASPAFSPKVSRFQRAELPARRAVNTQFLGVFDSKGDAVEAYAHMARREAVRRHTTEQRMPKWQLTKRPCHPLHYAVETVGTPAHTCELCAVKGFNGSVKYTPPFVWNGHNYVLKMAADLAFLGQFEPVARRLGADFDLERNPLMVAGDGSVWKTDTRDVHTSGTFAGLTRPSTSLDDVSITLTSPAESQWALPQETFGTPSTVVTKHASGCVDFGGSTALSGRFSTPGTAAVVTVIDAERVSASIDMIRDEQSLVDWMEQLAKGQQSEGKEGEAEAEEEQEGDEEEEEDDDDDDDDDGQEPVDHTDIVAELSHAEEAAAARERALAGDGEERANTALYWDRGAALAVPQTREPLQHRQKGVWCKPFNSEWESLEVRGRHMKQFRAEQALRKLGKSRNALRAKQSRRLRRELARDIAEVRAGVIERLVEEALVLGGSVLMMDVRIARQFLESYSAKCERAVSIQRVFRGMLGRRRAKDVAGRVTESHNVRVRYERNVASHARQVVAAWSDVGKRRAAVRLKRPVFRFARTMDGETCVLTVHTRRHEDYVRHSRFVGELCRPCSRLNPRMAYSPADQRYELHHGPCYCKRTVPPERWQVCAYNPITMATYTRVMGEGELREAVHRQTELDGEPLDAGARAAFAHEPQVYDHMVGYASATRDRWEPIVEVERAIASARGGDKLAAHLERCASALEARAGGLETAERLAWSEYDEAVRVAEDADKAVEDAREHSRRCAFNAQHAIAFTHAQLAKYNSDEVSRHQQAWEAEERATDWSELRDNRQSKILLAKVEHESDVARVTAFQRKSAAVKCGMRANAAARAATAKRARAVEARATAARYGELAQVALRLRDVVTRIIVRVFTLRTVNTIPIRRALLDDNTDWQEPDPELRAERRLQPAWNVLYRTARKVQSEALAYLEDHFAVFYHISVIEDPLSRWLMVKGYNPADSTCVDVVLDAEALGDVLRRDHPELLTPPAETSDLYSTQARVLADYKLRLAKALTFMCKLDYLSSEFVVGQSVFQQTLRHLRRLLKPTVWWRDLAAGKHQLRGSLVFAEARRVAGRLVQVFVYENWGDLRFELYERRSGRCFFGEVPFGEVVRKLHDDFNLLNAFLVAVRSNRYADVVVRRLCDRLRLEEGEEMEEVKTFYRCTFRRAYRLRFCSFREACDVKASRELWLEDHSRRCEATISANCNGDLLLELAPEGDEGGDEPSYTVVPVAMLREMLTAEERDLLRPSRAAALHDLLFRMMGIGTLERPKGDPSADRRVRPALRWFNEWANHRREEWRTPVEPLSDATVHAVVEAEGERIAERYRRGRLLLRAPVAHDALWAPLCSSDWDSGASLVPATLYTFGGQVSLHVFPLTASDHVREQRTCADMAAEEARTRQSLALEQTLADLRHKTAARVAREARAEALLVEERRLERVCRNKARRGLAPRLRAELAQWPAAVERHWAALRARGEALVEGARLVPHPTDPDDVHIVLADGEAAVAAPPAPADEEARGPAADPSRLPRRPLKFRQGGARFGRPPPRALAAAAPGTNGRLRDGVFLVRPRLRTMFGATYVFSSRLQGDLVRVEAYSPDSSRTYAVCASARAPLAASAAALAEGAGALAAAAAGAALAGVAQVAGARAEERAAMRAARAATAAADRAAADGAHAAQLARVRADIKQRERRRRRGNAMAMAAAAAQAAGDAVASASKSARAPDFACVLVSADVAKPVKRIQLRIDQWGDTLRQLLAATEVGMRVLRVKGALMYCRELTEAQKRRIKEEGLNDVDEFYEVEEAGPDGEGVSATEMFNRKATGIAGQPVFGPMLWARRNGWAEADKIERADEAVRTQLSEETNERRERELMRRAELEQTSSEIEARQWRAAERLLPLLPHASTCEGGRDGCAHAKYKICADVQALAAHSQRCRSAACAQLGGRCYLYQLVLQMHAHACDLAPMVCFVEDCRRIRFRMAAARHADADAGGEASRGFREETARWAKREVEVRRDWEAIDAERAAVAAASGPQEAAAAASSSGDGPAAAAAAGGSGAAPWRKLMHVRLQINKALAPDRADFPRAVERPPAAREDSKRLLLSVAQIASTTRQDPEAVAAAIARRDAREAERVLAEPVLAQLQLTHPRAPALEDRTLLVRPGVVSTALRFGRFVMHAVASRADEFGSRAFLERAVRVGGGGYNPVLLTGAPRRLAAAHCVDVRLEHTQSATVQWVRVDLGADMPRVLTRETAAPLWRRLRETLRPVASAAGDAPYLVDRDAHTVSAPDARRAAAGRLLAAHREGQRARWLGEERLHLHCRAVHLDALRRRLVAQRRQQRAADLAVALREWPGMLEADRASDALRLFLAAPKEAVAEARLLLRGVRALAAELPPRLPIEPGDPPPTRWERAELEAEQRRLALVALAPDEGTVPAGLLLHRLFAHMATDRDVGLDGDDEAADDALAELVAAAPEEEGDGEKRGSLMGGRGKKKRGASFSRGRSASKGGSQVLDPAMLEAANARRASRRASRRTSKQLVAWEEWQEKKLAAMRTLQASARVGEGGHVSGLSALAPAADTADLQVPELQPRRARGGGGGAGERPARTEAELAADAQLEADERELIVDVPLLVVWRQRCEQSNSVFMRGYWDQIVANLAAERERRQKMLEAMRAALKAAEEAAARAAAEAAEAARRAALQPSPEELARRAELERLEAERLEAERLAEEKRLREERRFRSLKRIGRAIGGARRAITRKFLSMMGVFSRRKLLTGGAAGAGVGGAAVSGGAAAAGAGDAPATVVASVPVSVQIATPDEELLAIAEEEDDETSTM